MCKTPRKHAELIKAWADGAEIEFKCVGSRTWVVLERPAWDDSKGEYRIKPEKKSPGQLFFEACEGEPWGEQGPRTKKCYEGYAEDFLKAMKEQE